MRRIIAAGAGALLFLSLSAAPASSQPYVGAAGGAFADASAAWILLDHDGGGDFYFAEGVRQAWVPDGVESVGFVARGRCNSVHTKRVTMVVCEAMAQPHPVSLDEFSIDPLLRSASLSLRVHGMTHRVKWVGAGSPGAGQGVGAGPGWVSGGAGVSRWAKARGTLFGHRLRSGGHSMAYLAISALGYAFADPSVRLTRTLRSDGTMLVRFRAPLR